MYQSKKYIEEGLNFDEVFPEKQTALRNQNFDFDFQQVADFVKIQSQDFAVSEPELQAIDKQIEMVVNMWRRETEPTPVPAPAPAPAPTPAPTPAPAPEEDEELSAEKIQKQIDAISDLLEFIGDAAQRAIIEEQLEALKIALEVAE
jgi:hypothetical protein